MKKQLFLIIVACFFGFSPRILSNDITENNSPLATTEVICKTEDISPLVKESPLKMRIKEGILQAKFIIDGKDVVAEEELNINTLTDESIALFKTSIITLAKQCFTDESTVHDIETEVNAIKSENLVALGEVCKIC